jgi:hypothetical protein
MKKNKIIFIHIMKTAGTSFRKMMQEGIGIKNIYPSDKDLEKLPNGWYILAGGILESYNSLPPHKVLIGHFPAAIIDEIPTDYSPAIFLRDPLQRSLSLINYYSKIYKEEIHNLISKKEFMAKYIEDYQTKILGMELVNDPNIAYDVNDKTLTKALQNLEKFDFVGITEYFEKSCQKFDKIYNTNTCGLIKKTNVSRENENELMELKEIILPYIEKDYVVYEKAAELFRTKK